MAQISVIMPVYNAEKFLQEAVDSVLDQTFSDFEFLICDDCSTDHSPAILEAAAAGDKRIKLLYNTTNLGCAASLNRLLEIASAPLIARMDADDICEPERLQKQYDYMQTHPEIAVSGGQLKIIGESGIPGGERRYETDSRKIRENILCRNPIAHPAVIMRRDVVVELNGYCDVPGCEDYDLWIRVVNAGKSLANIDEILLHYRLNANQIKQRQMKRSLLSTIRLQRKYLFKRDFFSFKAFLCFTAEHILLLFPDKLLLAVFKKVTYQ